MVHGLGYDLLKVCSKVTKMIGLFVRNNKGKIPSLVSVIP